MVKYIQFVSSPLVFSALSSNFYKYLFSLSHTTVLLHFLGALRTAQLPYNAPQLLIGPLQGQHSHLANTFCSLQERAPTCKSRGTETAQTPSGRHRLHLLWRHLFSIYNFTLCPSRVSYSLGAWPRWCRFLLFHCHKLHEIPTTVACQHILSTLSFPYALLIATTLKAAVFDKGFSDLLNKFCV